MSAALAQRRRAAAGEIFATAATRLGFTREEQARMSERQRGHLATAWTAWIDSHAGMLEADSTIRPGYLHSDAIRGRVDHRVDSARVHLDFIAAEIRRSIGAAE